MKNQLFWAIALASLLVACDREPAVEKPDDNLPTGEPAAVADPVPPIPEFDEAFIDHMHLHADQMDELMFALDDGDLEGAANAAKWLSRHPAADRIPDAWLPYLEAMRAAARGVENATDIDAARDAAERITVHCQECHAAAGILSSR
jgi:hypothetical protein